MNTENLVKKVTAAKAVNEEKIVKSLNTFKNQLGKFSKMVNEYSKVNFDNTDIDSLFDNKTVKTVDKLISSIDDAQYELREIVKGK